MKKSNSLLEESLPLTKEIHPPPLPNHFPTDDRHVLPLFMVTIFLSSLLVFSVQPLFAKMVLPLLGGSPGVWNTAMLFFQIVLLLGYIYAHLTTRLLGVKWQAWLHVSVMSFVILLLPIGVAQGWTPPLEEAPVPWLIGLFAVSVGLPFFAVATNAPLLQRWFSHTQHRAAADPYFLYGASNLGSILALVSYPLVFEPLLTSQEQSHTWQWAYIFLVGLIALCALTLWQRYHSTTTSPSEPSSPSLSPVRGLTLSQRLHWLVLAFVPSSLLLGVTMHITTDVAAVPLLWVLPLMLYLLTFVVVFARRPWLPHTWMLLVQPFLLICMGLMFHWIFKQAIISFCLHVLAFFVTAMVCHGELAKRRPAPEHLTEFYLWMSFGGMLGGIFNVLLAPLLFHSVVEYPLMLVLACFLRPLTDQTTRWVRTTDVCWPALLLFALGLPLWLGYHPTDWGLGGALLFFILLGLSAYSFRHRPVRFGLGIAVILLLTTWLGAQDQVTIARERSFFGVNTVQRTTDGKFHLLVHGNTIHGAQHTDPTRWKEPLTYFYRDGPLHRLLSSLNESKKVNRVGVLGLGAGTLVCFRLPHQQWTYYEIDPSVVHLAQDPRYFHYLSECGEKTEIIYGDGRLSLATVPDGYYDLLIADAFSSDAVPMHLITREALTLYLQKLTPGGHIVFNISNRNLDLSGVMGNLAEDAGLVGRIQLEREVTTDQRAKYQFPSYWVIMAKSSQDLQFLENYPRWQHLTPDPNTRVWSDDYSNILEVLKWRK